MRRNTAAGRTEGLEVQRHHLAAHVPEELRHVVGAVHSRPFGVDPAQLVLIVPGGVLLGSKQDFHRFFLLCLQPLDVS